MSPRGRQLKVTGQKKLTEKWNQSVYLHKANNSKNNSHSLIIRRTCEWEYPSLFSKSARIKQHFPRKATHPFFFFLVSPSLLRPVKARSIVDNRDQSSLQRMKPNADLRRHRTLYLPPVTLFCGAVFRPQSEYVSPSGCADLRPTLVNCTNSVAPASVLNAHTRFFFFFLDKTNKNAST